MCVGFAGRHQAAAALLVEDRAYLLEGDAGEPAAVVGEGLGHQVVEDRDAFVHRVLLFPGLAFICSKPERTMTLTSSPPRRRDERQQSIAVLPPPSTITRLPIEVVWPKATLASQSMPRWMFDFAASLRPGMSRSWPRGAPEPTKTAS
jgi:hypothetical protein